MTTAVDQFAKQKRYCKRNPNKKKAHDHIGHLIRTGKIKPAKELKCAHCPDQANSYHHPNGYEGEYIEDIVALCQGCHIKEHF